MSYKIAWIGDDNLSDKWKQGVEEIPNTNVVYGNTATNALELLSPQPDLAIITDSFAPGPASPDGIVFDTSLKPTPGTTTNEWVAQQVIKRYDSQGVPTVAFMVNPEAKYKVMDYYAVGATLVNVLEEEDRLLFMTGIEHQLRSIQ